MIHKNELYLHFYNRNRELIVQLIYANTYWRNHKRTCYNEKDER
jgi:hypothetical protein